MKTCSKCKEEKTLNCFFKGTSKDGLHIWCKDCCKQYAIKNKEKYIQYRKEYFTKNQEALSEKSKADVKKLKLLCLNAYGGPICNCCQERIMEFLSIDHVNGNGNQHRLSIGGLGGRRFYNWLKRNNFPPGFQVLCMNCQFGK